MKIKYGRSSPFNVLKKTIITTVSLLVVIPVTLSVAYFGYVFGTYYRIGDKSLEINKKAKIKTLKLNEEVTVTSYNIGFGAYSDDYTFFMDTGYDEFGNPTSGEYGKARSKEEVLKNTYGAIDVLNTLNSDFNLIQEVDQKSHRAHFVNQQSILDNNFADYDSTYALNFDSAYLFYPFHNPHGKTVAGISTYSKYEIKNAMRKEYVVTDGFAKYMDLDRCFSTHEIEVENGKKLILINSHMSAYDEGGKVRNAQIKELNEYMLEEVTKGNYVVCGGDFNHDLLTNNPDYSLYTNDSPAYFNQFKQFKPDWLSMMFNENKESNFDKEFKVYASDNEPSCRDADVPFEKGYTYVSTIDGFICSSNVEVTNVFTTRTGENGFIYSDHQPTTLSFKLK